MPDIRSFKWVALIAGVAGSALIAATIWVAAAIYGSFYDTYNAQPRLEVASQSDTPPDTLAVLAADRRSDVRSAVASNRSSGPEALAVLAEDPDSEIRALVGVESQLRARDARRARRRQRPAGTGMCRSEPCNPAGCAGNPRRGS